MNMQTSASPARVYDQHFVPALFQYWGDYLANTANIKSGQQVLDVACGTGVLACAVAERIGEKGEVVGLDLSNDMLDVARRKNTSIVWRDGQAESLPFGNNSFDHVMSQFGFMFFSDQRTALREMMRVLRPGGHLTVAVCDAIDHSPGYAVLAELLQRLFGIEVADAFRAPFASGNQQALLSLCLRAGITHARVERHDVPVTFPSIQSLVSTERACAWTLGGLLDEAQFDQLYQESEEAFQPFLTPQGEVAFNMPALVINATKQ